MGTAENYEGVERGLIAFQKAPTLNNASKVVEEDHAEPGWDGGQDVNDDQDVDTESALVGGHDETQEEFDCEDDVSDDVDEREGQVRIGVIGIDQEGVGVMQTKDCHIEEGFASGHTAG